MKLSIVSPVYKAEEIVDELVQRITESVSEITDDFEIILVEDGSPDKSWLKIYENSKKDKRIKGIKLSRNFGQQHALTAGLKASKGDYVVVIDCDLQFDPVYIIELYRKINEDYDIVYAKVKKRTHPFLRNIYSFFFMKLLSLFSDCNYVGKNLTSFSILSRKVVDAFCKINDAHRHYLLLLRWLGFKHSYIEIIQNPRFSGRSSYSFLKLWEHAIDGIVSQSDKLLRLSISTGLGFSILSILFAVFLVVMYFVRGFKEGWTSLMVLILFSTGVILISIGILGIYVGKVFEQSKNRPLYIIDEEINTEKIADSPTMEKIKVSV